jgi:hypothetical protein
MVSNSKPDDPELGLELSAYGSAETPPSSQSESTADESPTLLSSGSMRGSLDELPLTQEELDDKPWKYIGYRGYSEFLSSENDWLIFRRFGVESARVALGLQNRASGFAHQLSKLDKKYSRREAEDVHNGSFRGDQKDRKKVFDALHQSLLDYSEFPATQLTKKASAKI